MFKNKFSQAEPYSDAFSLGNEVTDPFRDLDSDGMPDDMQLGGPDLDADGMPDDMQLGGPDLDADGMPDDMQLGGPDLDADGIPDDMDSFVDLDGNGFADF